MITGGKANISAGVLSELIKRPEEWKAKENTENQNDQIGTSLLELQPRTATPTRRGSVHYAIGAKVFAAP